MGKPKKTARTLAFQQWGPDKARLIEVRPGEFEVVFPSFSMPVPAKGEYSMEDAYKKGATPHMVLLGVCRGILHSIVGQLK